MIGPRANPTPEGLETAADLARAAHQARRKLYLEIQRLLDGPDRETIRAWAESLTETNCDWRLYEVGQRILTRMTEVE
jgi:hypothetical protein